MSWFKPKASKEDFEYLVKMVQTQKVEIKAKDKEIERLNCRAYHAEGYINDLHNHPKDKKFYDAKARSIVAMLFWNYKRNLFAFDVEATVVVESKRIFEKAYKMLKDNK